MLSVIQNFYVVNFRMFVPVARGDQKRGMDPLELDLGMVVKPAYISAGDRTPVLWKSKCS